MPKKFFDVIPPNQEKVVENNSVSFDTEVKKEPVVIKRKRHFLRNILISIIIFFIIGFVGLYFFSDVEVSVWPKAEAIAFSEIVTIDLNATDVDLDNAIIPAQEVNNEKVGSEEFSSSGKAVKESKATGFITIYNNYSTASRSLVPSRFVSADGKLFWSLNKVTVPGKHYEGGKLVPGEKQVEVEASEAGPDYNIGATTFALPALAGTALYTTIYAKSSEPMSGGYKGEVGKITQSDVNNAENVVVEKLKAESRDLLKKSLSSDIMLPDETIIQEVIESKSSHSVGTEVDSFSFDAKVKSNGLSFKRLDIEEFVKTKINSKIEEGFKIQEGSLEIDYVLKEVDLETGKITISLNIEAIAYEDINLIDLEKAILGKSIREAEIFLNNLLEIDKVELDSGSFLRRSIPEDMDKVKIQLILDY